MPKDTYNSRLLSIGIWFMALATVGFMIADLITRPPLLWLSLMPIYCLAAFALLHSFTFLGPRRALWLLVLGLVLAYVAEYLGTNFGAIFGSHWFTRARDLRIQVGLMLPGRVPLATVLNWYGQLYLVFVLSVFLVQARPSDVSAFSAAPLAALCSWRCGSSPPVRPRSAGARWGLSRRASITASRFPALPGGSQQPSSSSSSSRLLNQKPRTPNVSASPNNALRHSPLACSESPSFTRPSCASVSTSPVPAGWEWPCSCSAFSPWSSG
ncbi:MAG: hypothetical protein ABIK44_04600 [candidate division WOR-3 bacterium]